MGNYVYIFEISQVLEKRINYVGNDLDLYKMAQICGEMTKLFDKRLKNVENDLEIWKWSKYLGNGLSAFDTALIFENLLYYVGNGLRI